MVDLVEKEKAVRAYTGTTVSRIARHARAAAVAALGGVLFYAAYVIAGIAAASPDSGTVRSVGVASPVHVYRDERGIPHIRASTVRDAFFAEGFVQASDRLFQMDLFRRYVYGQLAEVVGPIQLPSDELMRTFDVRDIVARQWSALPVRERVDLQAFAAGVNSAMSRQPLPAEFRLLLYTPAPWKPEDSLAVTIAMSLSLEDTADNVIARDALWRSLSAPQYAANLPLSDSRYDVGTTGEPNRSTTQLVQRLGMTNPRVHLVERGSNAWAAGGARSTDGRALLANDPHLALGLPDVFYALEMRAPGLHVAGVTVPGIPGVILGHDESIAWATTNAMASTISVFQTGKRDRMRAVDEAFNVRFLKAVRKTYYRTRDEYEITDAVSGRRLLVRWPGFSETRSAISTILALDTAKTLADALACLRTYAGPPQNFMVADTRGFVAYHVAGRIPNDPSWGRYIHPATEILRRYPAIPFSQLPSRAPSRTSVLLSANNKMYRAGYPYRISPMFAPPYRAYRIADLLHARGTFDVPYFTHMQMDTRSPADAEFAHRLARYARTHADVLAPDVIRSLARWNGDYASDSRTATLEHQLRMAAENAAVSPYGVFTAVRSESPDAQIIDAVRDPFLHAREEQRWGTAGAVGLLHPFGAIGFPFLNGRALPGSGDQYTVHVQTPELAQSFRAVWDVGAWDRGGLSLPGGESGEIGSRHYDDLTSAWLAGGLQPLPFSDDAVRRAAATDLLLEQ